MGCRHGRIDKTDQHFPQGRHEETVRTSVHVGLELSQPLLSLRSFLFCFGVCFGGKQIVSFGFRSPGSWIRWSPAGLSHVEKANLSLRVTAGRPCNGPADVYNGKGFEDHVLFYEFFHGDTGTGLGASHQTGWTALVAKLIQQSGRSCSDCSSRE